ncbi:MAG: hypothetical protein WD152_02335 [Nitriliruptoraceae bacterium]
MRPGPPRGTTASLDIVVTSDMCASDSGEVILPVYSTQALVGHLEQVSRSILEPHLEEGEAALGVAVDVRHREFVPVGERITLEATVASVEPHRLVCEVMVRHRGSVAIRATFEHQLISADEIRARIAGRTVPSDS